MTAAPACAAQDASDLSRLVKGLESVQYLLDNWATKWIADGEIYAAFWTIDGVLATLDAADII